MTSARQEIITSLADKEYRDAFVSEDISQGLAFQIRAMRTDRGLSQAELGRLTGMQQARISQIEDPDYEGTSLTTLKRLASALDVALIVRFAPFSALVDWSLKMTYSDLAVPEYGRDKGFKVRELTVAGARRTLSIQATTGSGSLLQPGDALAPAASILPMADYTRNKSVSPVSGTAPLSAIRMG